MGFDLELTNHSNEWKKELDEAMERALDAIGQQCVSHAKQEIQKEPNRVDTGLLINSIAYALGGGEASISEYKADRPRSPDTAVEKGTYSGTAPSDNKGERSVYVGSNVEYAIYVHEGTSRMDPNRFLTNAAQNYSEEYKAIFDQEMKKG